MNCCEKCVNCTCNKEPEKTPAELAEQARWEDWKGCQLVAGVLSAAVLMPVCAMISGSFNGSFVGMILAIIIVYFAYPFIFPFNKEDRHEKIGGGKTD
jgi:hypothetical protein